MRAVNLLPRDEQKAKVAGGRTPILVLAGGIAAVTAAAVMLGLSASGIADEQKSQLSLVEASLAALPKPPSHAISQGTLAQERTDRFAALAAALSTRVSFDTVLQEISYVLPEDAWLTGFRAMTTASAPVAAAPAGTAAPAAAPEGVTIQGATYTHDAVARVLVRLSAVPSLANVRLTTSARVQPQQPAEQAEGAPAPAKTKKKQKTVVTFTISASLATGGS